MFDDPLLRRSRQALWLYRTQGLNMVTPLVAMTGSASPDAPWASFGFSDLILKPLNKDAFTQQLQQWSNQDVRALQPYHACAYHI
jgi:CheY-like chemotaxis protein